MRENLRLLVKYTCYFDIKNPKVCCPNDNLYRPPTVEPFADVIGVRLPVSNTRRQNNNPSSKKISFPESFASESPSVPIKSHHIKEEGKFIKNGSEKPFAPLLFPSEFDDEDFDSRSNFAQSQAQTLDNDKSRIKNPSILKKDLRHHPNFRLIPPLSGCSNAVKLDSLLGTYGSYPWLALIGIKRE